MQAVAAVAGLLVALDAPRLVMRCALCDRPAREAGIFFTCIRRGERVQMQLALCDHHGETMLKHLKRAIPKALMTTAALLLALASPLAGQTRADSLRAELVRARGFVRAAETQLTKTLALAAPPEPGPPVVLDWRTGEWALRVAGEPALLDLDAGTVTVRGAVAPVAASFAGDTLRARLRVPGYEDALLEMVHGEGRMIGAIQRDTLARVAAGERPTLLVVRTVERDGCTFAQYTDGSWGHAPNTATCFQALLAYAGPMRFTPRVYTP